MCWWLARPLCSVLHSLSWFALLLNDNCELGNFSLTLWTCRILFKGAKEPGFYETHAFVLTARFLRDPSSTSCIFLPKPIPCRWVKGYSAPSPGAVQVSFCSIDIRTILLLDPPLTEYMGIVFMNWKFVEISWCGKWRSSVLSTGLV